MTRQKNKKVTHAGAVILRKNRKTVEVLLTKRVGGKVPGFFLTQGHIEVGEEPEITAFRLIVNRSGRLIRLTARLFN